MTENEALTRIYLDALVYSRKHPQAKEIAAKLEEIKRIIKANGSREKVKSLTKQIGQQMTSK